MHVASIHLRPMGIGDIFDTMFRLYRNNFLIFIGIAALMQIPFVLIQLLAEIIFGQQYISSFVQLMEELAFFNPAIDSIQDLPIAGLLPYLGISLLLTLAQIVVVQQLISGALANAISQRYLDRPVSILGAYNMGSSRLISLLLVGVLVGLIASVIFVVLMGFYIGGIFLIISAVSTQGSGGIVAAILAFLGLLFFLLVFILLLALIAVRFLFVTQAVVIEGRGPLDALARSWRLVSGSFWRVLGIAVLLYILVQVIVIIPAVTANFALGAVFGSTSDPLGNYTLQQTILILVNYCAQILVWPLQLGAYTLIYYDLRIRKEGYDLQLLAQDYTSHPGTSSDLY